MDTIEAGPRTDAQLGEAKLLNELPLRLHHNAYVVKDHEANRRFLEDLLGIPLVATWCERTWREDSRPPRRFLPHVFRAGRRRRARASSSLPIRKCTS